MASKIKGITIEIGGDTQPLNKALGDVNKTSRDLQGELRQVEKLLKLDPTNTELLAQKQKILGDSVSNTKEKLDRLKEAERQAQEQFKQGKISEDQYRALQREVIKTEQDLKKLESQGLKAQAVLSKEDAVKNLKKIALAAGAASLAIGGALVGSAIKAGQAADDINTLAKQTGLATDQIQKFQYATELIDVPLETLTRSMAKLTKNMQTAKEASDLGRQLTGSALAFEELGISVLGADGQLRNNQDVFDETIKKLAEMENETQRDAYAMQIFGKSAQDLNPLILGGADALRELGEEAEEAGLILSQDALDSANEFNDSIDKLKATSSGTFMKIGTEVAQKLIPVMEALSAIVKDLPGWFERNKTSLELAGVAVGTVTALVIAFNIQQALLASGMTLWGAIAGVATTATTALGTAFTFLTGPIGLTILFIGAVIAAGVLLYKNWDEVKEFAAQLMETIKEKFEAIRKAIVETWEKAKKAVRDAIRNIATTVKETLTGLVTAVFSIGSNIVTGLWDGIASMASWIKDKISGFVGGITNGIKGLLGIQSPSKVFAGIGENIGLGLVDGILSQKKAVENALGSLTSPNLALSGAGSTTTNYNNGGNTIVFNVTGGWDEIERELHRRGVDI